MTSREYSTHRSGSRLETKRKGNRIMEIKEHEGSELDRMPRLGEEEESARKQRAESESNHKLEA